MARDVDRAVVILTSASCTCRVSSARHHATRVLVELLAERGRASWSELCETAKNAAQRAGYTDAASTAYLRRTEPASQFRRHALWMQGFIADGDARHGERFTDGATRVRTKLDLDGSEPIFMLA